MDNNLYSERLSNARANAERLLYDRQAVNRLLLQIKLGDYQLATWAVDKLFNVKYFYWCETVSDLVAYAVSVLETDNIDEIYYRSAYNRFVSRVDLSAIASTHILSENIEHGVNRILVNVLSSADHYSPSTYVSRLRGSTVQPSNLFAELVQQESLRPGSNVKENLIALGVLAQSAFSVTLYDDLAIFLDFPRELHVDNRNRLHNERGPALSWGESEHMYFLHGVEISEDLWQDLDNLTAEFILNEPNAEVRRSLMSIMGEERFLRDAGAEEVVTDGWGTIYKFRDPQAVRMTEPVQDGNWRSWLWREQEEEPAVFIKVVNATPEPDGSYKDYFIRVDPSAYGGDTQWYPQAAVASTWRRRDGSFVFENWHDYVPTAES